MIRCQSTLLHSAATSSWNGIGPRRVLIRSAVREFIWSRSRAWLFPEICPTSTPWRQLGAGEQPCCRLLDESPPVLRLPVWCSRARRRRAPPREAKPLPPQHLPPHPPPHLRTTMTPT